MASKEEKCENGGSSNQRERRRVSFSLEGEPLAKQGWRSGQSSSKRRPHSAKEGVKFHQPINKSHSWTNSTKIFDMIPEHLDKERQENEKLLLEEKIQKLKLIEKRRHLKKST